MKKIVEHVRKGFGKRHRTPVLGWSLHLGSWQAQHERMVRWYERANRATDPVDRLDFLYAFFGAALVLRTG